MTAPLPAERSRHCLDPSSPQIGSACQRRLSPQIADEAGCGSRLLVFRTRVQVVDQRAGDDCSLGMATDVGDVLRRRDAEPDDEWDVAVLANTIKVVAQAGGELVTRTGHAKQ